MVGQIVDLILEEFTLNQLEPQVMFSEAIKRNAQVLQMFLLCFGKDNHIIQVD